MNTRTLAVTVMGCLVPVVVGDTVVWSQLPASQLGGAPVGGAATSNTNPSSVFGQQKIGDNFQLASATTLTRVEWWGFVYQPPQSYTVAVYDAAGLDSGVATYSEVFTLGSSSLTITPNPGHFDSTYSATFGIPVNLGAGEWWLAVSGNNAQPYETFSWMHAYASEEFDNLLAFDWDLNNSPEWNGIFGPNHLFEEDRSFQLFSGDNPMVPLPTAACTGLAGMAVVAGRRRRRID